MKTKPHHDLIEYLNDITGPNGKSFINVKCLVITPLDDTKIKSKFTNSDYTLSTIDEFVNSEKKLYDTILCYECLHDRDDLEEVLIKLYQSIPHEGFLSVSCAGLGRQGATKPVSIRDVCKVYQFEREFTWLNINYNPVVCDLRFEGYKA